MIQKSELKDENKVSESEQDSTKETGLINSQNIAKKEEVSEDKTERENEKYKKSGENLRNR